MDFKKESFTVSWKSTALIVILAVAPPLAAAPHADAPPQVPANLDVPAGHRPFFIGRAEGTQNYVCLPSGAAAAWSFFGPQATLFDGKGEQIATHFLAPNPAENGTPRAAWQHSRDTSTVWAVAVASSSDPAFVIPGAVPWLLLQVSGIGYGPSWGDRLTTVTFIQRVNTAGGVGPGAGCSTAADIGRKALVPYTTDYVFYRARN